ncbi:MAG: aspartate aminotransferase family protein, partial [Ornithinimicrobium sp.]
ESVEAILGLTVQADPSGPLIAVRSDPLVAAVEQVDPHLWAAAVATRGFVLQGQPELLQPDGTQIVRTTHLTITPVTEGLLPELLTAVRAGADDVRGREAGAPDAAADGIPDPAALAQAARSTGEIDLTTVLSLIEALPREDSARLLTDFLAEFTAPR